MHGVFDKLRAKVMKSEGKDIFAKRVSAHLLSLSNDGEYVVEKKDMLKSGITNM